METGRAHSGTAFYLKRTALLFTSLFIKLNYLRNHKSVVFAVQMLVLSELVILMLLLLWWRKYISLVSRPHLQT